MNKVTRLIDGLINALQAFANRILYGKKEDIGGTGTLHVVGEPINTDDYYNERAMDLYKKTSEQLLMLKPNNEPIYKSKGIMHVDEEKARETVKAAFDEHFNDEPLYQEPKQDLLVITLEDIDSVPKVYYKGKPVTRKMNVDFNWGSHVGLNRPLPIINIGYAKTKPFTIEHIAYNTEYSTDKDLAELQGKHKELQTKYDNLLREVAGYMIGDTDDIHIENKWNMVQSLFDELIEERRTELCGTESYDDHSMADEIVARKNADKVGDE